ncbi:MAG: hypothetical protein ACOYN0_09345 [Phycisphaerales bacterium]
MARKPQLDGSAEGFGWRRFLSHLTGFGVLVLCCGLLAGAAIGLRPLERRSAELSFREQPTISIEWPPIVDDAGATTGTWLPSADQEAVLRAAKVALGDHDDPFSRDPLERIGVALAASGWFDGSPHVTREKGSQIVVQGRWRIPAAVVRHDGRDFLIDQLGRPLPPIYSEGESTMKFLANPVMPPPMNRDGAREFVSAWAGEDIAAGLELLGAIAGQPWAKQVAGIELSSYSSSGSLELITSYGTRVVWGGRASKPLVGDVSTAQKLANINALTRRYGRIDGSCARAHIYRAHVVFDTSASAEAATARRP